MGPLTLLSMVKISYSSFDCTGGPDGPGGPEGPGSPGGPGRAGSVGSPRGNLGSARVKEKRAIKDVRNESLCDKAII